MSETTESPESFPEPPPGASPEGPAAGAETPAPGDANIATAGEVGPAATAPEPGPESTPESAPGSAPDAAAVPERYELASPEGMALDEAMLAEFTPVARDLGLTNEQAQSLADAYARRMQAMAAGHLADWNSQTDRLAEAVLADREIGGGEAAFAEKRAVMKRGLSALGDLELARAIEEGRPIHPNSPGLLRAFYRLGLAAREDGFAEGGLAAPGAGSGPQAWARALYPSLSQPTAKE